MIYYFDSRMPVCDYEWTHEERIINTKKRFFQKSALFKRICVSFFVSTELLQKTNTKTKPSLPLPCIPAGMSHLHLLKGQTLPSKHPTQGGGNSTPKLALAYPRAAFVVLSLSLQGLFIL